MGKMILFCCALCEAVTIAVFSLSIALKFYILSMLSGCMLIVVPLSFATYANHVKSKESSPPSVTQSAAKKHQVFEVPKENDLPPKYEEVIVNMHGPSAPIEAQEEHTLQLVKDQLLLLNERVQKLTGPPQTEQNGLNSHIPEINSNEEALVHEIIDMFQGIGAQIETLTEELSSLTMDMAKNESENINKEAALQEVYCDYLNGRARDK